MNEQLKQAASKKACEYIAYMFGTTENHLDIADDSDIITQFHDEYSIAMDMAVFGANWQRDNAGWISVEERLPENEWWYRVLVDGKHHILPHTFEDGKWYEYAVPRATYMNITHWQHFDDLPQTIKRK